MSNSKSSKKNNHSSKGNNHLSSNKKFDDKKIQAINENISKLSYENALQELDSILNQLKNESLLVDDLQENYVKAKLYLNHCEKLIENIESEVIEINTYELFSDKD